LIALVGSDWAWSGAAVNTVIPIINEPINSLSIEIPFDLQRISALTNFIIDRIAGRLNETFESGVSHHQIVLNFHGDGRAGNDSKEYDE
jgi:hypothetical protein